MKHATEVADEEDCKLYNEPQASRRPPYLRYPDKEYHRTLESNSKASKVRPRALGVQQYSTAVALKAAHPKFRSLTVGFRTHDNPQPPAAAIPTALQPPTLAASATMPLSRARALSATTASAALQPPALVASVTIPRLYARALSATTASAALQSPTLATLATMPPPCAHALSATATSAALQPLALSPRRLCPPHLHRRPQPLT